jgi:hypothetical protein
MSLILAGCVFIFKHGSQFAIQHHIIFISALNRENFIRFEVFTAVTVKNGVF